MQLVVADGPKNEREVLSCALCPDIPPSVYVRNILVPISVSYGQHFSGRVVYYYSRTPQSSDSMNEVRFYFENHSYPVFVYFHQNMSVLLMRGLYSKDSWH